MNCCDDFGKCTQGENCPVRIHPYQEKESHEVNNFNDNDNYPSVGRANVRLPKDTESE